MYNENFPIYSTWILVVHEKLSLLIACLLTLFVDMSPLMKQTMKMAQERYVTLSV